MMGLVGLWKGFGDKLVTPFPIRSTLFMLNKQFINCVLLTSHDKILRNSKTLPQTRIHGQRVKFQHILMYFLRKKTSSFSFPLQQLQVSAKRSKQDNNNPPVFFQTKNQIPTYQAFIHPILLEACDRFDLPEDLTANIERCGYNVPTPVQKCLGCWLGLGLVGVGVGGGRNGWGKENTWWVLGRENDGVTRYKLKLLILVRRLRCFPSKFYPQKDVCKLDRYPPECWLRSK